MRIKKNLGITCEGLGMDWKSSRSAEKFLDHKKVFLKTTGVLKWQQNNYCTVPKNNVRINCEIMFIRCLSWDFNRSKNTINHSEKFLHHLFFI